MPKCVSKFKNTPIINFNKTSGRISKLKSRPVTSMHLDYDSGSGKDFLMPKLNAGHTSMSKIKSRENKGDRISISLLNAKSSF